MQGKNCRCGKCGKKQVSEVEQTLHLIVFILFFIAGKKLWLNWVPTIFMLFVYIRILIF